MSSDPFIQQEMLDALTKLLKLVPSLSGTIYVDANHGGIETGSQQTPFRSVQSASFAAKDSAEISVRAGFYSQPLLIDRAIRITGRQGDVYLGAKSEGFNLVGEPIISPFAPYQGIALGDLNCDGARTMVDALLIHLIDWQDPPHLFNAHPFLLLNVSTPSVISTVMRSVIVMPKTRLLSRIVTLGLAPPVHSTRLWASAPIKCRKR